MKPFRHIISIALLFICLTGKAAEIRLFVTNAQGIPMKAEVFLNHRSESFTTNALGHVTISGLDVGLHYVSVFAEGLRTVRTSIPATDSPEITHIVMHPYEQHLGEIKISDSKATGVGMSRLKNIEAGGLYAAKKNEIILPDDLAMNRASNNSRQAFAKVPGMNAQETDAGGLQLGVSIRGLDPARSSSFNTRQDGYDISADALGYPESYYTPPMEAVQQIELVRGAASLQYGTQFGGLLNFKMKRGVENKRLEVISRLTTGSYGYLGSFTSAGGSTKGWNYYFWYQHKEGSGWRPNTRFNANAASMHVSKKLGEKWSVEFNYTHSHYLNKQPGGLTDRMFEEDPSQSVRTRNWFRVNWNVAAVTANGQLTKNLSLNSTTFALSASRAALGFLGNINRNDTMGKRDLILGEFTNLGHESRLIQRFNWRSNPGAVLIGTRLYSGNTRNRQGLASATNGPDFQYLNPDALEGSDYRFPSQNAALFSEAVLPITPCWLIAPGVRFEYIRTQNQGYYRSDSRHPLTNELLESHLVNTQSTLPRSLILFGIGSSYRCLKDAEVYANVSQNYRAVNFSDLRVNNPNLLVDSNLRDEHGFSADLGIRGKFFEGILVADAGVFAMVYRDRIGEVLRTTDDYRIVRLRTNVADALYLGVEAYHELNLSQWFLPKSAWKINWHENIAMVSAQYQSSEEKAFDGNRVENVATLTYKTGLSASNNGFRGGVQLAHISSRFTDATNAEYSADATSGLIPAFTILDLSIGYTWKRLSIESSVNNLLDTIYFTRRATGYPGPGIIPAERRMIFVTLGVRV